MNIIILGCGRVGSTLARSMHKDGHNVTVIDVVSEAFRRLGTKFKGQRVVGNGMDEDVLKRAAGPQIESPDMAIVPCVLVEFGRRRHWRYSASGST